MRDDAFTSEQFKGEGGDVALRATISEICGQRDLAIAKYGEAAAMLAKGYDLAKEAADIARRAHHGRDFYGADHEQADAFKRLFGDRFDPEKSITAARKAVDAKTWMFLRDLTGLDRLMDAEAKKEFDRGLAQDVPEITEDTVRATLQSLMGESDEIMKRGMANVFSNLDRRFRSHNGFKIGSRIIIDRMFNEHGSLVWGRQRDMFMDIERIFSVFDGVDPSYSILDVVQRERGWSAQQSEHTSRYFKIRCYKNGNCHLWFARPDLVERVNKTLAEFYGDVIPDGMDDRAAQDVFRDVKLTPAKRFGFFPSPDAVVDALFDGIYIEEGERVLEPSAGTGQIARVAAAKGAKVDCVEIQRHLADGLEATGAYAKVHCQDFHEFSPAEPYAKVIMNPPFDRGRDIDHIMRAWDMLAPGGVLVSVMHAGIEFSQTKKAKAFRAFAKKHRLSRWGRGPFRDLPEGSFRDAGTNVNTVIVALGKGAV